MTCIKQVIFELILRDGFVTFGELKRQVAGFEGQEHICHSDYRNLWLWDGMSSDAADSIIELLRERRIFLHRATIATQLTQEALLLPIARKLKNYPNPHWLPCVLHHTKEESGL